MGQIVDAMDSVCVVGCNNELYFIGCGFTRSAVHSYDVNDNKWTERGYLNSKCVVDATKAIASNGLIYVVYCKYIQFVAFQQ